MSGYECRFTRGGAACDAVVSVEKEGLDIRPASKGPAVFLDYADLYDYRLINYHLFLELEKETWELSQLGYQTEEFFEKLWLAYDARSREALFLEGSPLIEAEGDYEYQEGQLHAKGKAKLALYEDCLCILPHNAGARRIPLCFAAPPVREGFSLTIRLDTGDVYTIARLGYDTDPFFEKLAKAQAKAAKTWAEKHRELEQELASGPDKLLGGKKPQFEAMKALAGCASSAGKKALALLCGLFAPEKDSGEGSGPEEIPEEPDREDSEPEEIPETPAGEDAEPAGEDGEPSGKAVTPPGKRFWLSAVDNGEAAVELITEEQSAIYLYRFQTDSVTFAAILRHAMESVGSHRELIYLEEERLNENALYRMAVVRNRYVRYLRSCWAGRIIHSGNWEEKLKEFLR